MITVTIPAWYASFFVVLACIYAALLSLRLVVAILTYLIKKERIRREVISELRREKGLLP